MDSTDERRRPPEPATPETDGGARGDGRWAVILAGGDGTRLLPLTRLLAGDERPKQFCALVERETLLDVTRRRVGLAVDAARTLIVVTKQHERYYEPLVTGVPRGRLLVQPKNAGTAAAVLYALMRVRREDPGATVAVIPSDHHVSDDAAFMAHVERAFAAARRHRQRVVVLGIPPESPETEYGWIEPGRHDDGELEDGIHPVRRFWEKPPPGLARTLMTHGCLWNSLVMVGGVDAFLGVMRRAVPALCERFDAVAPALGGEEEGRAVAALYAKLPGTNFSRDVLAARPASLAVLVADGVRWSDLGRPDRAIAAMRDGGGSSRVEERAHFQSRRSAAR